MLATLFLSTMAFHAASCPRLVPMSYFGNKDPLCLAWPHFPLSDWLLWITQLEYIRKQRTLKVGPSRTQYLSELIADIKAHSM